MDISRNKESLYQTGSAAQPMLSLEKVKAKVKESLSKGTTRICLSVAWREIRNSKIFDNILEMVRELSEMGIEVCCTLGMLELEQAHRLAEAGLHSYNHNLDTSETFYPNIITSHGFQERIATLDRVQQAGIEVCCGGIFGLGESVDDRLELLRTLANRAPQPLSVPLNQLVRIPGTPLANNDPVAFWEFLPLVAIQESRYRLP